MNIKPIIAVLSIAGMTHVLTACEPLENVLKVANNGQPMPGGPSPSVAVYVSPVASVERVEVALETVAAAEPCVVPPQLFRSMQCDEGGNLVPIR